MLRPILCLLAVLFAAGCTTPTAHQGHVARKRQAAPQPSTSVIAARPLPPGTRLKVRTTAYTQTEPGGWANAVGGRLRYNMTNSSAASDWSWLPVGTRFRMLCTGRIYVIEDYGSALVGRRTIDLFYPSRRLMRQWGMRHVDIEILQWGSPRRSLEVLGPRRRHWHTRQMVAALNEQSRGYPEHFHRIRVN